MTFQNIFNICSTKSGKIQKFVCRAIHFSCLIRELHTLVEKNNTLTKNKTPFFAVFSPLVAVLFFKVSLSEMSIFLLLLSLVYVFFFFCIWFLLCQRSKCSLTVCQKWLNLALVANESKLCNLIIDLYNYNENTFM